MRRYAGSGVKKNSYDAAQEIIISSRYSILLKKYVHVHLWLPKLMIICNLKHSTYYYSVSAIRIRYPMSFKKDVHISIAIMPGFKYSTCFYLQSQSASCPMPSTHPGLASSLRCRTNRGADGNLRYRTRLSTRYGRLSIGNSGIPILKRLKWTAQSY
jgi:hypothetical protein